MSDGARPLPSLERVSRGALARAIRLRRLHDAWLSGNVSRALTEVCGAPIWLELRRAGPLDATPCPSRVAVRIAALDADGGTGPVLVDVEGELAAELVSRALRRPASGLYDTRRTPAPELAGAFAAVVTATLRRAGARQPVHVLEAGTGEDLARTFATLPGPKETAWLTLRIGPAAYDVRVSVREGASPDEPGARWGRASLLGLGDATIALRLVLASACVARADLRTLVEGDLLVVPVPVRLYASGEIEGPVALLAPRSERGICADLARGKQLVIREGAQSSPWSVDLPMDSSLATTLDAIEDAPLVVRVELGAVELRAKEWAELRPGDVLSVGRKLGSPATLRVGGVEIAQGELVDLDGQYAVRILSRGGERA